MGAGWKKSDLKPLRIDEALHKLMVRSLKPPQARSLSRALSSVPTGVCNMQVVGFAPCDTLNRTEFVLFHNVILRAALLRSLRSRWRLLHACLAGCVLVAGVRKASAGGAHWYVGVPHVAGRHAVRMMIVPLRTLSPRCLPVANLLSGQPPTLCTLCRCNWCCYAPTGHWTTAGRCSARLLEAENRGRPVPQTVYY